MHSPEQRQAGQAARKLAGPSAKFSRAPSGLKEPPSADGLPAHDCQELLWLNERAAPQQEPVSARSRLIHLQRPRTQLHNTMWPTRWRNVIEGRAHYVLQQSSNPTGHYKPQTTSANESLSASGPPLQVKASGSRPWPDKLWEGMNETPKQWGESARTRSPKQIIS